MPVVFAPPEPNPAYTGYLSAVASSANRALPIVADLYGQAARNAAGIGVAGAQLAQRAAEGNADRLQQAGLAMQGLQQRSADRELEREQLAVHAYPTARDAFLAQQQQALQSADLSQREVIRMQRLQQARGEVFAQLNAGRLDKDTAADLLTQITAGVSPLEARAQASRQRLIDQQTKEAVEQAQRASAVNQVNLDIAAGNYQKHLQRVPMGGGKFAVVGPDGKGGWIQLKDPADRGGENTPSMKELESIARTRFDAYVKDQLKPDIYGERKLSPQDAEKKYHEILAGVVAQYGGGAVPGQPNPGQPEPGGERSPPGQPAAAVPPKKRQVEIWQTLIRRTAAAGHLSPEQKANLQQTGMHALELVRRTGGPDGMSPAERQWYQTALKLFSSVPPEPVAPRTNEQVRDENINDFVIGGGP